MEETFIKAGSILIAEPFMLGVNKAFISTSIGITFYPDDSEDVDALLKNSEYSNKNIF